MLHIIQNDADVPPGNICDYLTIPYIIHHPYRDGLLPEPKQISALLVLGGAMGANDDARYPFLTDLKRLIRAVVETHTPYLGICLGGQLLAAALGARVVSHRWEELGTLDVALTEAGITDRLFARYPPEFSTFHWHHDSFDLPEGGVLLASSAACPHQSFRIGVCAWGLQFHPEMTEQIIRDWCAWDSSLNAETEVIVADFMLQAESYNQIARHLIDNFIRESEL